MQEGDDVHDADDNLPLRAFMKSAGERRAPISHKIDGADENEQGQSEVHAAANEIGLTLKRFYADPVISFARIVAGLVGVNNLDSFVIAGNTALRDIALSMVRRSVTVGGPEAKNTQFAIDQLSGFSISSATEAFYTPKLYGALKLGMMKVNEINSAITTDDVLKGGDANLTARFAQYIAYQILKTQNMTAYSSRKFLIDTINENLREARVELKKAIENFNRGPVTRAASRNAIEIDDL